MTTCISSCIQPSDDKDLLEQEKRYLQWLLFQAECMKYLHGQEDDIQHTSISYIPKHIRKRTSSNASDNKKRHICDESVSFSSVCSSELGAIHKQQMAEKGNSACSSKDNSEEESKSEGWSNTKDSSLDTDYDTLETICQEAICALEQKEQEIERLVLENKEQNDDFRKEKQQLEQQFSEIQNALDDARKLQDQYQQEATEWKQKLEKEQQLSQEKQAANQQLFEREIERITNLYENQSQFLQQLQEEKSKLTEQLKESLSSKETELQSLEQERRTVCAQVEELQKKLLESQEEMERILEESKTRTNEQVERLKQQLSKSEEERTVLVRQLETKQMAYDNFCETSDQAYKEIKAKNESLVRQQQETKKNFDDLTNEYRCLRNERDTLKMINEALQSMIESFECQHRQDLKNIKRETRYKELEAMERERRVYQIDVRQLRRQKDQLASELEQMKTMSTKTREKELPEHKSYRRQHYDAVNIPPQEFQARQVANQNNVSLQKEQHEKSHNRNGSFLRNNFEKVFSKKSKQRTKFNSMPEYDKKMNNGAAIAENRSLSSDSFVSDNIYSAA